MGLKESLFGSDKAGTCEPNEDGSLTCRRTRNERGELISDGQEITFAVDPKTCKPILGGRETLKDGDKGWAVERINREIESCKRGLA